MKKKRKKNKKDKGASSGNKGDDEEGSDVDLSFEHEPVYCICRQVQHGDMVACDNPDCTNPDEWYHFQCVGLLDKPPEGTLWHCPVCKPLHSSK